MPRSFKLLLASDLHGSTLCFLKLIDLALELEIGAIVVAGDWSGKQSILVAKRPDGSASCMLPTKNRELRLSRNQLEQQLKEWRDTGTYPILLEPGSRPSREELVKLDLGIRAKRLQQWLDYGQTKTKVLGGRLMAIAGNEDGPEIIEVLAAHPWVCDLDERVVGGPYTFLGLGYSNRTPWKTPRELSEDELDEKLRGLAREIKDWANVIGVIHVPPFDSRLDLAPEVRESRDGPPRLTGRGDVPVGSRAVRAFAEKYSPLAIVSGHCHTSRGIAYIGRTACVNPGSQYHKGTLSACRLDFNEDELTAHQFFLR